MKKALITGGAGYIGHHLQKELKKHGYYVIVMDIKHPGHLMSKKYCDEYLQTNIKNYDHILDEIELGRIFEDEDFGFDIVFHLAGLLDVGESEEKPISYYETNVSGTINILRLMKRYNCDKIVFSSSAAVYNENGDECPTSVYGRTKLLSETILKDASKEGIHCVNLRYFNVSGADVDGEFGENHEPETHLIPRIFTRDDFTVYGNDFPTPDGTCVRDYIHVSDLAVAHIKAAEYLYENKVSCHFNIGSGAGYSVLDVLAMVEKVTGNKIDIKYSGRRAGDPASLFCDTKWTEETLKFSPQYGLEDIIRTAYQWEVIQQRRPNGTSSNI